jgi:hypothetical protein
MSIGLGVEVTRLGRLGKFGIVLAKGLGVWTWISIT